jgi:Tfp pilus assembly protein PilX
MRVFDQGERSMLKKIKFWLKATSIFNNEEGSVIIAALMVLVLLTIIGIASTNVSNTEVKISTHNLIHQQNFYRAEGATMEAVAQMEDPGPPFTWLTQTVASSEILLENGDLFKSTFWESGSAEATPAGSTFPDTNYAGAYGGLLPGEPLEIGSTKRHRYAIYGRSAPPNRGAVTVEIGYIKAF